MSEICIGLKLSELVLQTRYSLSSFINVISNCNSQISLNITKNLIYTYSKCTLEQKLQLATFIFSLTPIFRGELQSRCPGLNLGKSLSGCINIEHETYVNFACKQINHGYLTEKKISIMVFLREWFSSHS